MKKLECNIVKKLMDNWPWLLPVLFMVAGVIVWEYTSINQSDKISVSVLLGTAIIYSLQFINMRQSSKNQEAILKQQCDIAQKQHNFDVFALRMNLRNDLVKAFTMALSSEDLSITNDVNMHLVNIGKICEDIKFAFPRSKELEDAIKLFKKSCDNITRLATDKQLMIECSLTERASVLYMVYRECLRVVLENGKFAMSVIDKEKLRLLGVSEKEKTIILGTMCKYIVVAKNKEELDNHMYLLFNAEMSKGNVRLNAICKILDKSIKL